jgi:hypothetical protein
LRRQELQQKQKAFQQQSKTQNEENVFERKICDFSLEQARKAEMERQRQLRMEREQMKEDIKQKQAERDRERQKERMQTPPSEWIKRAATPPVRRGKFISPFTIVDCSAIY